MKKRNVLACLVLSLLLCFAGLVGCNDDDHDGDGSKSGTVTVSGQVTGSGGLPDVSVSGGGQTAVTDANGFYLMQEVSVPADGRLVLSFAKAGLVPATRILDVDDGGAYAVSVALASYDSTTSDLDPADAIAVAAAIDTKTVLGLEIPAGSLQGTDGNVDVSMFYGDPTTEAGLDAMPGDFMAAESAEADADIQLESIAFTEISITDDQGNEITEFSEPAKVRLRLPDDLQDAYMVGDMIPWWSFDEEKGIWVREDADPAAEGVQDAEVVLGDDSITLYAEAWVTHLSWWNCDQPIDTQAVICVSVYDCETDQPLANVQVEARGATYNGSSYATTDAEGLACLNVKRSTGDLPERVTLRAEKGPLHVVYQVASAEEGNEANEVFVPYEQASTLDGSGKADWLTLANRLCLSYDGRITGTISYEETSTPVAGIKIYSDVGVTAETDELGQYELKVPRGDLLLFVPGVGSRSVTVGESPVQVDFELPNRAPVIGQVALDPAGLVESGGRVVFTAQASDPDGDPITYAWSASAGTPATKTGATFTWTAPADAGTAVITLTVTDDKGAAAAAERSVTYGGSIGGTTLKFTLKDDPESNQPVSGVHVVLYESDNTTIADYKVTDAQGVADFGNVGRDTVTVTLAYEQEVTDPQAMSVQVAGTTLERGLHTIVEFPAGDHVYYVEGDEEDAGSEAPVASINATLNWGPGGVPVDVYSVSLMPFSATSFDTIHFTDVPVDEVFVQTDNQISLLAVGAGEDYFNFSHYGFLTDRALSDGATYTIPMDRTPADLDWNAVYAGSGVAAPLEFISVAALRKDVAYSVGGYGYDQPQTFGTIKTAADFPGEVYLAEYSSFEAENFQMALKRFDTLPATLTDLPVPDMRFTAFEYGQEAFTWSTSGTMVPDVLGVDFEIQEIGDTGTIELYWEASMAGDKTSWTVPELPAAIASWIDRAQIGQAWMDVYADDFSAVSGYTQVVGTYLSGGNPYDTSDTVFMVERENDYAVGAVAGTYSPLGVTDAEPASPKVKSGLSGFLRR